MKVELYLPYYDYNDGAFDVSNDYYGDEQDYIKAMSNEYNKNKDIVYNSMLNGSIGSVQGVDGQTYKFGEKTPQNEEKVAYSSCNGVLYNDTGVAESVDGLINQFAKQKPFVEMVEFDDSSSEEEFISEMSLWVKEHNAINKYREFKGDEWTWVNEPKRNVKIHFLNNANEDIYAIWEDCKIMDIIEGNTIILFIEKMRLIDYI